MDYSLENLLWLTALLLLVIYWLTRRTTGHLPPSPMKPLPIVGHLLYLDKDMKSCFMKWRKQCGDIFSLHLGSRILIVINGFDLINETFVKRANDFSDRPVMSSDKFKEYHSKGIVFTSGKVWKEQRDVSLSILRRFGLGKNLLAQRVLKEVDYYLNLLGSYGGQPVDIRPMTIKSTANVMCSILTGQRFDYEDPTFERLIAGVEQFMVSNNQAGLFDFMPFLKYLPGCRSSYNRLQETLQNLYYTLQDIIDRCKYKEPEDNFIASYQAEKEARINNGEDTSLDDANFLKCVFDLFLAGTETTATTVCWFILYMLNYPDIQSKVFHEISQHVGTTRPISMQDRPNLVYLRATIQEAQRVASILPHSVARFCPKEIQIRNYDIPKGSFIIPNLDSVLFDEKIWGA